MILPFNMVPLEIKFHLSFGRTIETFQNRKALGFYGNLGLLWCLHSLRTAEMQRRGEIEPSYLFFRESAVWASMFTPQPALTRVKYKMACSRTVTPDIELWQKHSPWFQPAKGLWATSGPTVRRRTPPVCQCLFKTVSQHTHFQSDLKCWSKLFEVFQMQLHLSAVLLKIRGKKAQSLSELIRFIQKA